MRWEITVVSCKQVRKEESVYTGFQHSFLAVCYLKEHSVFCLPPKLLWIQSKTIKSSSLKVEGTNDSADPNPHGKEKKVSAIGINRNNRNKTSAICLQNIWDKTNRRMGGNIPKSNIASDRDESGSCLSAV